MAKAATTTGLKEVDDRLRAADFKVVPSGIKSGDLLALYNEALQRDTHYSEFVGVLVKIGGYTTELAARQRLSRFRSMLQKRGLQLKPLKGSTLRKRDNSALKSQFACLMDSNAQTVGDAARELGLKRGTRREVKRK